MNNKDIIKKTLIISLIIIIIDQITKAVAVAFLWDSKFEIIENIFSFDLTQNEGIAWGMNPGNIKNLLIASVIIILIIRFIYSQKKYLNIFTLVSLDFILAGGISNIIDRIIRGGVIDFISFSNFPIFNIADVFIVIGWGLFAFYIIKFDIKSLK